MSKAYRYEILSRYRTELMRIVILWVMFFNLSVVIENPRLLGIKTIGYGGVDIFLYFQVLVCIILIKIIMI